MPASLSDETVMTLPFAECVSEGNGNQRASAGSRELAKRLQELIEQIQQQPAPAARALLNECLQTMLALYGDGLERILGHVKGAGAEGQQLLNKILHDSAVSGLLLIHGLHPLDLENRLRQALESVRPYMQSHGGNIELLSLENDVARVKLAGTCKTCPSSIITLQLAVKRAVEEACPDLLGFEVIENEEPAPV